MNSRPLLALVVLLGLGVFPLGCGGAADDPIPSAPSAAPSAAQDELDRVLERLMATPNIEVEDGFTARVLIPPGELYDPLFMRDHEGEIWMNDDGGEEGDKGSKIVAVDAEGGISTVIALGRLLPVTSFDIAPSSFGSYEGQLFSLAQPEIAFPGATMNHIIQRVDPTTTADAERFCTLPMADADGGGISGIGFEARFGPEGSPFSGKFFAATIMNGSVYQVTADGTCTSFVRFERGSPTGIAFSEDGQRMLVATSGAIQQVRPDGTVDEPLVRSDALTLPTGMAYAPAGFGTYGGQLFVADMGNADIQMTQATAADGKVYRVDGSGEVQLVASGFHNPVGLHFVDGALWVTDINGDFIAGRRELPEGFVVELRVDR